MFGVASVGRLLAPTIFRQPFNTPQYHGAQTARPHKNGSITKTGQSQKLCGRTTRALFGAVVNFQAA